MTTPPADPAPPPPTPRMSCADCGLVFEDSRGIGWDDRWPCPRCGSLKRAFTYLEDPIADGEI